MFLKNMSNMGLEDPPGVGPILLKGGGILSSSAARGLCIINATKRYLYLLYSLIYPMPFPYYLYLSFPEYQITIIYSYRTHI